MKNEPAYPVLDADPFERRPAEQFFGLTKREYFAGLALQATISNHEWLESLIVVGKSRGDGTAKVVCDSSVEFADSLLEALNEIK